MKGHGDALPPAPGSRGVDEAAGMTEGMRVLSHLIAGVAVYGALGWLGDHFLHTGFLLPLGIVLGAGLGIYTTIKRVGVTGTAAAAAVPDAGRSSTTPPSKRRTLK